MKIVVQLWLDKTNQKMMIQLGEQNYVEIYHRSAGHDVRYV